MQVVWTDPALERVDEIAVYIARDDPDAAARWTIELFDTVERLTQFPENGLCNRLARLGMLRNGFLHCATVLSRGGCL